jgi:aspartate carbamoyltransferase catalytic subunit
MAQGKIIYSIDDFTDVDLINLLFPVKHKKIINFSTAVLMTAFMEPSTRTRLSFEMAALRLGMKTVTFMPENSSLKKGEAEEECLANLLALGPDILVIRSKNAFSKEKFLGSKTSVINGGDGIWEHPTQSLIDVFTLFNHWQVKSLVNKNILIIGDICHSRVARSNIKLMSRLGAKVILLAPKEFFLLENLGQSKTYSSFDDLDCHVDAIMVLRIQKERMNNEMGFDDKQYYEAYGLSLKRFLAFGNDAVLLHPGPVNLNVEIDRDVAYHQRSLIMDQVRNGIIVRSSLLAMCLT